MAAVGGFLVFCPAAPGRFDGVADYSCWLASALAGYGPARLVNLAGSAEAGNADELPCLSRVARTTVTGFRELWVRRREPALAGDAVLLQWVPQSCLMRRDVAWLLLWLAHVRLSGRRLAVTVHEYTVPASGSVRRVVAGALMRAAMLIVGGLATLVVTTFEMNRRRLARLLFWKAGRVAMVPVGSNIPQPAAVADGDVRAARDQVVCVLFGQPGGMSPALVTALGGWLGERRERVRARWIGRSRAEIMAFWRDHCGLAGHLVEIVERPPGWEVSHLLRDADLFLAPVADGVSGRRGTVVAALAHGLPIVGTDGPCTDTVWRSDACLLSAVDDSVGFRRHLDELAADMPRRARMGRSARALFDARFTWERIAQAYLARLAPETCNEEICNRDI